MITVGLTLDIGKLEDGALDVQESYDLECHINAKHLWECENVNSLLCSSIHDKWCDYAELFITVSVPETSVPETRYLIASFRKIKLKGKGCIWRLVD